MSKIRLSHSALDVLHTCERMFQLDRLLSGQKEREQWPATVFGTAFGVAVAIYLSTQDADLALYKMLLAYHPNLRDDDKGRSQQMCGFLFLRAVPELDRILQDWEIISFGGKPAIELSFRLNIDDTFYHVGYIDVVLKNRWTGRAAILDVKTTGMQLHDLSPLYANSGQGLGYSIVLDRILGEERAEYDVLYFIGQIASKSPYANSVCKLLTFPKTLQDRLHWFISLGLDVNHLKEMMDLNIFPRRGDSCLQYMKPCKHFGTCGLHALDIPKEEEIDDKEYQFVYQLDEVIADHIRRIS